MKHVLFLSILTAFAALQGWAQNNSPEEKSIVNKEYDENGNLIQYDSTYVWQWNSDSTFNFSFGDKFNFGKDFPGMFGEFFNDSIFGQFGLGKEPFFQPFGDDDFFRRFEHSFPGYPFERDSAFNFGFGNKEPFNFDFKELEDLQKQLQEKFNQHNLMVPEFKSPEQQDEWEKLIQKQQKEKEELIKKFEKSQKEKIY
jgi:hypothetical protein